MLKVWVWSKTHSIWTYKTIKAKGNLFNISSAWFSHLLTGNSDSYLAGLNVCVPLIVICWNTAAAAAKLLQSCPTLCDPVDSSPPGAPTPGILYARTLEWVAISFSNAWKWKVKVKWLSHVWLLATPWTAAYQAPPSMGLSRQEYWSGVPLPSPCWNTTPPLIPQHDCIGR